MTNNITTASITATITPAVAPAIVAALLSPSLVTSEVNIKLKITCMSHLSKYSLCIAWIDEVGIVEGKVKLTVRNHIVDKMYILYHYIL